MSLNEWDTDQQGNFTVFPCTGWSTATFMKGMSGGLRLEYATDQTLKNIAANQLIITSAQARELSVTLINLADAMDAQVAADKPTGPMS